MKKFTMLVLLVLIACMTMAQPHQQYHHGNTSHASLGTMVLTAAHDEVFQVYVDGDLMNRQPMRQVQVTNLAPTAHEVYVVLKRPYDKITMLTHAPQFPREDLIVSYNTQTQSVEILTTAPQVPHNNAVYTCPDVDVDQLVHSLKDTSFDNERLARAKGFTSHTLLSCRQISKIVKTFSFDDAKMDYLKYAFSFCSDPHNYYQCVEQLTFSSNRSEVLEYLKMN